MDTRKRKMRYLNGLRYGCKHGKVDKAGNPVSMNLTLDDLDTLLAEAGITIWDVGRGKGAYCLARKKDLGNYEVGNARFLTQEQNGMEFWNEMTPEEQEAHRQRGREYGPLGAPYGFMSKK